MRKYMKLVATIIGRAVDKAFELVFGWEDARAERRDRRKMQALMDKCRPAVRRQSFPVGYPKYKGFEVSITMSGWQAERYPKHGKPVFVWANTLKEIKEAINNYWAKLEGRAFINGSGDMNDAIAAVTRIVEAAQTTTRNEVIQERDKKLNEELLKNFKDLGPLNQMLEEFDVPPKCIHGKQGPCIQCTNDMNTRL